PDEGDEDGGEEAARLAGGQALGHGICGKRDQDDDDEADEVDAEWWVEQAENLQAEVRLMKHEIEETALGNGKIVAWNTGRHKDHCILPCGLSPARDEAH